MSFIRLYFDQLFSVGDCYSWDFRTSQASIYKSYAADFSLLNSRGDLISFGDVLIGPGV